MLQGMSANLINTAVLRSLG